MILASDFKDYCLSVVRVQTRHRLLETFTWYLEKTNIVIAKQKTGSKSFLLVMKYLKIGY